MPTRILGGLQRKLPAPFRRLARYGFVGVAISLFYSAAVIAFVALPIGLSPTLASVIAFILTLPVAWLAHGSVSFSDRPYDKFQPLRFAVTNVASFVAAVGGMYWITAVGGHSYLFGIAWNWFMIPAVNFVVYLFWVFRDANVGRGSDLRAPSRR